MEGVGARLGRSSSRYSGPAVVFSGPVRKWRKKWVPVQSLNNHNNNHHHSTANTNPNTSHLFLYKWTPVIPSPNGGGSSPSTPAANGAGAKEPEDAAGERAARRRRFRYAPISVIEEQKQETTVKADEESTEGNADVMAQNDGSNPKSDIGDVIMLEVKDLDEDRSGSQEDASETHLDLNLGLKAHDGKHENDQTHGGDDSMMNCSETEHRGKRKVPDLEMRM